MTARNSVKIEVTLTGREAAFLDNLARGTKPTQAAIDAGYAGPTAARLIHKPWIEATIRAASDNLLRVISRIERERAEMAVSASSAEAA